MAPQKTEKLMQQKRQVKMKSTESRQELCQQHIIKKINTHNVKINNISKIHMQVIRAPGGKWALDLNRQFSEGRNRNGDSISQKMLNILSDQGKAI